MATYGIARKLPTKSTGMHSTKTKIIQVQGKDFLIFRAPEILGGALFTFHPTNFFAAMVALWPPKPNELFTMAFTVISRAVFGT